MARMSKKTKAFFLGLKFIVGSFLPEEMDRKHLIRISERQGKAQDCCCSRLRLVRSLYCLVSSFAHVSSDSLCESVKRVSARKFALIYANSQAKSIGSS